MTEATYTYACDLEGERASCFLAQFAETPCWGRLEKAHLIRQQTIRREVLRNLPDDDQDPQAIMWDQRVWVPACEVHHHQLDKSKVLRIPRAGLPSETEEYAQDYDLTWWLDRTYGESRVEVAPE